MSEGEMKSVPLKVEESRVSVRGLARIHVSTMGALGLKERAPIVVAKGGRAVLVHVYADQFVGKKAIRLRKAAMTRLQAKEGDRVVVMPHVTYVEGARKAVKKTTGYIKKKLKERRERRARKAKGMRR